MKVLLTGATGFIGSYFTEKALNNGHEVIALKRSNKSKTVIKLTKQPKWLVKDLSEITENDLKDISVVVHFAAHSANVPYDKMENCIKNNVIYPLNLVEKAINVNVKNFVIAGSCFEYGDIGEKYKYIPIDAPLIPKHTYPTSKAMGSLLFKQLSYHHKINVIYNRIFQVYGEGEFENRLWPSLKKAASKNEDFDMTNGEQIRDFIHVNDVAEFFYQDCMNIIHQKKHEMKIQHVGTGNPMTIRQFAEKWWKKWNSKGKLNFGVIPYRKNEVMRFVPEIDKN